MVGLRACPFAAGRLAALSGQVGKAVQVWPGAKVACRAGGPVLSTTFCPPLDWTIFFWLGWIPVLSGQIQALVEFHEKRLLWGPFWPGPNP